MTPETNGLSTGHSGEASNPTQFHPQNSQNGNGKANGNGAAPWPAAIRELAEIRPDRWVNWRLEPKPGKPTEKTKVPYSPGKNRKAEADNPETWGTLASALARIEEYSGIGYETGPTRQADVVTLLDLDACRELESGAIEAWAMEIVQLVRSYWEVSPSGSGLRGIAFGELPPVNRTTNMGEKNAAGKMRKLELCNNGKYFTLTGRHLEGTPDAILDCSASLAVLYETHFAQAAAPERSTPRKFQEPQPADLGDAELLEKARQAANGAKFRALFDTTPGEHEDLSAGDIGLCNLLAFWTGGDANRMDRLFRSSARMRDKWDERHRGDGATYGQMTTSRAIADCSETFSNGKKLARPSLSAFGRDIHEEEEAADGGQPSKRVIVVNGRHLHEVSDEAVKALADGNTPPRIFTFENRLARLVPSNGGSVVAQAMSPAAVRGVLDRSAAFVVYKYVSEKRDKKGQLLSEEQHLYTKTAPPKDVVEDVMERMEWPNVPPLTGIVTAPVVAPNGDVITEPGYHSEGQVYYHDPDGALLGDTTPTEANLKAAKALILDTLLADFPFKDEASKANATGLLISGHVLALIDAPAPVVLLDAPDVGTGKTLLTQALLCPFFRGRAPMHTEPTEETEWTKTITAALMEAPSHVVFDNVKRPLKSGALAKATTTGFHKDRILGLSRNATLPVRCAWVVNGNNVTADPDLARRIVWVRLDAEAEDPAQRNRQFKIQDMPEWLQTKHNHVATAALTLIRNWLEAGRPDYTGPLLGGYERWSRVVGGILQCAGIVGFLDNVADFRNQSDPEREAWAAFMRLWYSKAELRKEAGVKELYPLAVTDDILTPFLPGEERGQKTKLGAMLRKKLGKVVTLTDYPGEGQSIRVRANYTRDLRRAAMYTIEVVPEEF